MDLFPNDPDFCAMCGTIWLFSRARENMLTCVTCGNVVDLTTLKFEPTTSRTYLNRVSTLPEGFEKQVKAMHGPTVERTCRKCEHPMMYYVGLQLRSADEGQTLIYTCVSCGQKEVENS